MTNRDKQLNNWVFVLLLSSMLFDAYSLFFIGAYPVTVFTVVLVCIIVISWGQALFGYRKLSNFPALLCIVYLLLNCIFYAMKNIQSMLLFEFLFCGGLFLRRKISAWQWNNFIKIFQRVMFVLAIYGIYQLVGRMYHWPFTDLIWEGHMVRGYNWTNKISVGTVSVFRSNAIFLEPSFFSQFLAVAICIQLFEILIKKEKGNLPIKILNLVVFCAALLCTFSGTGILVLGITTMIAFIFFIKRGYIKRKTGVRFILVICALGLSCAVLFPDIVQYLIKRFGEIIEFNSNASSGYVRFIAGYKTLFEAWEYNPFFGVGIGNVDDFIALHSGEILSRGNAFVRVGIELGLIGILIWFFYTGLCIQRSSCKDPTYLILAIGIIVLQFMSDAFSMNYFWALLYCVNIDIVESDVVLTNKNACAATYRRWGCTAKRPGV